MGWYLGRKGLLAPPPPLPDNILFFVFAFLHIFQNFHCPLVNWFMVYWSVGPLVHLTIGPLVEFQMLNVNKVKLLSERTSGVPPVIFVTNIIIIAITNISEHSNL